jgi:cellobiose transport system substrate-binding protein
MLGYITSQAGDQASGTWDVAPLPGQASNWGGSWLGVPTASKHRAQAVALAEWLTAPEQQLTMWTKQQHFPSSSVAAEDPAVTGTTSDYFSGAPIGQLFGDSAANLRFTPISPYDTQIQQAFTTSLTNVETKGQHPDKAFQEALASANQAIGG